ncbi:MAG TPA: aminomethyl-transferring glycine dehydrogenase subunit GcvPA [bacterium]|nr:aminomethyl-transferring glycine dehydrogenase subunit GcvPA [bacterium]HQP99114.1 aminomethyl-transferring glycine dehydrogenase subunit GcvPA [bacterium]
MPYIPNTDNDRKAMLETLGLDCVADLFRIIPESFRPKSFEIPPGKSEFEVSQWLRHLAGKNATDLVCFLGGGYYDHFIPAAVDAVLRRGEFYTAYTPYQPEVSQGTLQIAYEYQTSLCRLLEMEVANASMYDGGTALYEAALMALRVTGRNKILVDGGVSPIYRKILYCYTKNLSIEFHEITPVHGQSDREEIAKYLDDRTAAIILQNPNFFGAIDDFTDIVNRAHTVGALAVLSVYPISLGLLKTPGEMNVDIATGEGQSLGLPLSFGGPYLGFMTTRMEYVRKMPGRIVGETVDREGKRGFVLTLQAREQHIRREKATSNICTNHALCALAAQTYMTLLGKQGLVQVARVCADRAEYARERLGAIPGVEVKCSAPTFNEFTIELPRDAAEVVNQMIERGFAAGFPLGRYYEGMEKYLLVAVTEKRTKEEIGQFAEALEAVVCH